MNAQNISPLPQRLASPRDLPQSARLTTPKNLAQRPTDASEEQLIFAMDELTTQPLQSQAPVAQPRPWAVPQIPAAGPSCVRSDVRTHLDTLKQGLKGLESPAADNNNLFDRADAWKDWTWADAIHHAHGLDALRALLHLMEGCAAPWPPTTGVLFSREEIAKSFEIIKDVTLAVEAGNRPKSSHTVLGQTTPEQNSAQRLTRYFLFPLDRWVQDQHSADSDLDSDGSDPLYISDSSSAKHAILRRVEDKKTSLTLHLGTATELPPIALYLPHLTALNIYADGAPALPDHLYFLEDLETLNLHFEHTW